MKQKPIAAKTSGCLMLLLGLLCASCSSTSNLEQDERLYVGIKELSIGSQPQKPGRGDQEEGVITALANAYNTVGDLLSGNSKQWADSVPALSQKEVKSMQQTAYKQDLLAYNAVKEELHSVLSYAPNNSILGSSTATHPFPVRLWIYNKYANSTTRWGRWMMNNFAATPIYVSTVNPDVRTHVAKNTLRNYGYLRPQISYDTIPRRNPMKQKISYFVTPGPLFHLGRIEYQHFAPRTDSLIQATRWQSLLHAGQPFSAASLDGERTRLSNLFRNNGYYYYQPQYVTFRADTLQQPLHVQLQVRQDASMPPEAGRQYHLGNTYVRLLRTADNYQIADTLSQGHFTLMHSGQKPPVKMNALMRYIFTRHGNLYRLRIDQLMQDKLQAMNIFSQVSTRYAMRDSTDHSDTLDIHITAVMDKPYDAEFEGKVTSKSNGQVGPGVSFTMSKRNAFRGAETLSLKAWGSYEWQTGANLHGNRSLINSYEYGANLNLLYPRLLFFGLGKSLNQRALSSTNFKLDAKWMNRANYFGRVSMSARVDWTFQRLRQIKHHFTPFRLDYDVQLHSTARFDSIVQANEALYVSLRNQFIPSMEYTLAWNSIRHAKRTLTVTLKEAGNVTSGIYALCGQPFGRENKELFTVPFAQYTRLTAEYTHKYQLTPRSQLAGRAFAGAVFSYGNSRIAPYSDLFSIGGANSIRAFTLRSIGPGSYHPATSHYSYIDEVGDLKLELNLEYRFPIVASLYGATFIDAGNVWLMRPDASHPGGSISLKRLGRDIALGTGAGLRYDLDFLVIRFDVGVGLHAPYATSRSGYYNMPSFGKSLGFHLAIGYPF